MIITLNKNMPVSEKERMIRSFEQQGLHLTVSNGINFTVLGLMGDTSKIDEKRIKANHWVESVKRIDVPYKLASRSFHPEDSVIQVGTVKVGQSEPIAIIGGPCSVEGQEMIETIAEEVKEAGAVMLRGGHINLELRHILSRE